MLVCVYNGLPVSRQIIAYAFTGNEKLVTLSLPDGNSIKYRLELLGYGQYRLASKEDQLGKLTVYTHEAKTATMWFRGMASDDNRTQNVLNLTSIEYPTGGKTEYACAIQYTTDQMLDHSQFYRIKSRRDIESTP